jgi:DNA polymerase-3 subunit delta
METPTVGPALAFYWGDDLYGLGRAAEAIGERVSAGGEPLERWRVDGSGTSVEQIAERIATAPLFGGGTLVVLSDPAPLLRSKADRDAVTALLGAVAPGNALVILDPVDGSGRRPAAVDALREAIRAAGGEAREFKAPKEGQLAAWIDQRARERSIRLGRGAAQVLAERVGGFVREGDVDRRRQGQLAVGELEKLALYRPDAEISPDDVRELVPEAVPGSTWALLDAIASRRSRQATELLERLLGSTPEPVLIVVIHRRLRELIEVVDRLASGETPGSLVRSMKLKPFRAEKLVEQAHRWTLPELTAALDGLLALDVAVKGADGSATTEGQRHLAFLLWVAERVSPGR